MKYIVAGIVITNDIIFADGRKTDKILGGSLYALAGIKPYTDDVLLVTAAGTDFDDYYGAYFSRNQLSTKGVNRVVEKTEYTTLEYHSDGRWWEYSKYREGNFHGWNPEAIVKIEFILNNLADDTRGIYMELSVKDPKWDKFDEMRAKSPEIIIMWELSTWECERPDLRDDVLCRTKDCDIYSLNLPESYTLFGTSNKNKSIQAIIDLGTPCFFRVGKEGSYMIQDSRAWFAPASDVDKSIDATGCGNCSTAAALYGFSEGMHPLRTAILANLAAGLNARQHGPYPEFTESVRNSLKERADTLFYQLREKN